MLRNFIIATCQLYVCINIFRVVKTKIQHAVAHNFGVPSNKIYLTKPTFFSQMTNESAKTKHDEYWHAHVDKVCIITMIFVVISLI